MIVFADTSALVKLYIDEDGSAATAELVQGKHVVVSPLAAAECYATFARRRREQLLTNQEHQDLSAAFARDWQTFIVVAPDAEVLEIVAALCVRHPLRGADALHLATALMVQRNALDITFACADVRLAEAARAEGVAVADLADPQSRGGP